MTEFSRVLRNATLISLVLTAPVFAATPAEDFIRDNVQRALAILGNSSLSHDDKRQQFEDFLKSLTDVRRIALFMLGPVAKTAASDDVDAFVEAFRDYTDAVYEKQLSEYSGQSLSVTGSIERAPGDFVVRTTIVDPHARRSAADSEVDFRVRDAGGKLVVTDASVHGVWLAIDEREQFTAYLAQHNNDVKALAADLHRRAADIRANAR